MCVIMLGLVSILLLTLVNHIYFRWVLVLLVYLSRLTIDCDDIQWTDRLKYLGITVSISQGTCCNSYWFSL